MKNNKDINSIREEEFKRKYESVLRKHRAQQCHQARPVNYSFLYTKKNVIGNNFLFLKTAAILLVFFMIGGMGVIFANSNIALAARFELEKGFYKLSSNFFTTDQSDEITVNEEVTMIFKSMDQIDKAKKFMSNLYIPKYIPSGQQLQNLKIQKISTSEYISEYNFKDENDNTLFVIMHDIGEMQENFNISAEGEITKLKDRTLFSWSEPVTGEDGIDVIMKNYKIRIIGTISHDEKVKVAEGLTESL